MDDKRIFTLLLIVFVSVGCSIHGTYTSNPKSLGAFGGHEISLNKDKTFHINRWSDTYSIQVDSFGKRIWKDPQYRGHGTFTKKGDFLQLVFLSEDSVSVEVIKSLEGQTDFYRLSFVGETGNKYPPIIVLRDSLQRTVKTTVNRSDLGAEFKTSVNSDGITVGFKFNAYEFMAPPIQIDLGEVDYGINVFKFKTYNGYYPKGTEVSFYCKRAWSGIRYGPKKRWLAKKYKSKWLNSFY